MISEQYAKESLKNFNAPCLSVGVESAGGCVSFKPAQNWKFVAAMCAISAPKSMDSGWGLNAYCSGGMASATSMESLLRAAKCLAYSPAADESALARPATGKVSTNTAEMMNNANVRCMARNSLFFRRIQR